MSMNSMRKEALASIERNSKRLGKVREELEAANAAQVRVNARVQAAQEAFDKVNGDHADALKVCTALGIEIPSAAPADVESTDVESTDEVPAEAPESDDVPADAESDDDGTEAPESEEVPADDAAPRARRSRSKVAA